MMSDAKAISVDFSPSDYITVAGPGDRPVSGAWLHVAALDLAFYKGVDFDG